MRPLLAFGRFADDPQRVLAAVQRLALVRFVLGRNIGSRIMLARFELSIAAFAHTDNRGRGFFDDPQSSVCHGYSLAPNTCANEMAPVPATPLPRKANTPEIVAQVEHFDPIKIVFGTNASLPHHAADRFLAAAYPLQMNFLPRNQYDHPCESLRPLILEFPVASTW